MPKPFVPLTLAQFRELLRQFPFTRQITSVHMHHTWRPRRADYKGLASIEGMFEFHTRERHFSDIAQHVTIAPDGTIWTGRNWNAPPASATGFNGNSAFGPFMFEMIGDFDNGREPFDDPQRETALQVIAAVQQKFGLPADALRFHNQMSTKTCPGSAIDFDEIVGAVRDRHGPSGPGSRSADDRGPFAASFRDDQLTGADRSAIASALESLAAAPATQDPAHAELAESGEEVLFTGRESIASRAARGVEVTPADLIALRPHVINLNEGQLTEDGIYSTLPADVERIFGEDIERAFNDPASMGMPPRGADEPFRVMIWAHGGLISEKSGLAIALKHLEFWKKNGVYPIYFVWETGLLQTIGQLLRGFGPGARNFFSDNFSDPLIEATARAAGGEKIWSGMKRNADLGSMPSGGATKAAEELKKFCARHDGKIELHAAGHSAGAIFHSHFLPRAFKVGIPDITALYLLAPAIRNDAFTARLLPLIGTRIKRAGMFTMFREQELDDHCAHVYRKSLLYLIRFSLEQEKNAEILGLEESMRRDGGIARLFGLGANPPGAGDVVFSPSTASDGQHASRSISHGGFDDDAPTMNSVALRVLNKQSSVQLAKRYPPEMTRAIDDPWTVPEVEELQRSFASAFGGAAGAGVTAGVIAGAGVTAGAGATSGTVTSGSGVVTAGSNGKRALCIGIDRYPVRPLAGCVADARLWATTLGRFGFTAEMLLDAEATFANIKARVGRLVDEARPGDTIIWQYSGHGTQVPDVNGDEAGGDSPGKDEAICPVDLQRGAMLTDDDIAEIIGRLAPGVSFTMIMDCCHSGTLNRFGIGEPPSDGSIIVDERQRFLPLTPDLEQAYREFAESARRDASRSRNRNARDQSNEVLFTACLSTEVAWESNGQGEFTVRATRLLSQRGLELTNEDFLNTVVTAFGPNRRQTPTIACAQSLRGRRLFQAFETAAGRGAAVSTNDGDQITTLGRFDRLANALESLARELRQP